MSEFNPVNITHYERTFPHGFNDFDPIPEIIDWYLGIDLENCDLNEALRLMAIGFVRKYQSLGATTGQYTSHHLKIKFQYLIERVIIYFEEENTKEWQIVFWDFVERVYRESRRDR